MDPANPLPSSSSSSPSVAPILVERVRTRFARPERVAESQFLRREIAGRMLERLALIRLQPQRVLDAGCGEGDDLLVLGQAYPQAQRLGVDAASAMLTLARQRTAQSGSRMRDLLGRLLRAAPQHTSAPGLACADFARLPLPPASVDLLWSNLALHWHPRPHDVILEWARVIRPEGLLMFSCFGPDTFRELREALQGAGMRERVLPFVDLHDYGDMLVRAGFADPVMDMEKLNITYSSADRLLADVAAFGGNPLQGRPSGLQGRQLWQRLQEALIARSAPQARLNLTIEVIYGHAFRPLPRDTRTTEHIVRFMPKES